MLTGVWNSVAGYVIIEIKGRGLERFINHAIGAGSEVWHVRRTGAGTVTACVSVEGFYALRKLVRGHEIRIRILEKHGLIMRLSRLRFRKVLLYGWAVVLALLIAASRRIWFIEIDGCDRVRESDVLTVLDGISVRPGARRMAVPTSLIGREIMESDPRIAWAGAQLHGVTLAVSIEEAEDVPELSTEGEAVPSSIFAAKDGVITGITVYDGKALVHVGDAVLAGQELITGVLRSDEENTLLTAARGTVTATVLYRFAAEAGPTLIQPTETGAVRRCTRLGVFGWSILSAGFAAEEWADARADVAGRYALTNCFLPLTAESIDLCELSPRETSAGEEQLVEAALKKAEQAMAGALPADARILSKESETVLLESGAVRAQIRVTAEESIGETKEIKGPEETEGPDGKQD